MSGAPVRRRESNGPTQRDLDLVSFESGLVVARPCNEFDIDKWLGEFAPELDTLDLHNWRVLNQRELVGPPGWNVGWDGYLESYHHKFVHPETVGTQTMSNLLLHDSHGPHQRIVLAPREIAEIADLPEEDWADPGQYIRQIHSGFPNLSISGILGDHALVTQLYRGPPRRRP